MPLRADRLQERVEHLDQRFLDRHIADFAGAIGGFLVRDPRLVGIEGFVENPERVVLNGAGVGRADAIGIGVHPHHLLAHGFSVIGEEDRVVERLAHLQEFPVRPRAARADQPPHAPQLGLDDRKQAPGRQIILVFRVRIDVAVNLVEAPGHLAGHLQVGQLVLADGHHGRAEGQDVGALAHGVHGKAEGVVVAQFLVADFILEGGVAHDPVEGQEHGEEEGQLVDGRHFALDEHRALVGIDPDGQPVGGDVQNALADVVRALGPRGEGVLVGDEEITVVLPLKRQAVFNAAGIVPQMQAARGRVAGEDAWFHNRVLSAEGRLPSAEG